MFVFQVSRHIWKARAMWLSGSDHEWNACDFWPIDERFSWDGDHVRDCVFCQKRAVLRRKPQQWYAQHQRKLDRLLDVLDVELEWLNRKQTVQNLDWRNRRDLPRMSYLYLFWRGPLESERKLSTENCDWSWAAVDLASHCLRTKYFYSNSGERHTQSHASTAKSARAVVRTNRMSASMEREKESLLLRQTSSERRASADSSEVSKMRLQLCGRPHIHIIQGTPRPSAMVWQVFRRVWINSDQTVVSLSKPDGGERHCVCPGYVVNVPATNLLIKNN